MIDPVKRSNVGDVIVDQIKELILQGKLKQGDKLPPERELMDMFKVGRTSLREALKVLDSQGLVERSQKGTIIANNFNKFYTDSLMYQLYFSDAEWEDIFESRQFIERQLAFLAAKRAVEADLIEMEKTINEMQSAIESDDQDLYVYANLQFHEKVAKASNNLVMYDLFNSISNLVQRIQEEAVIVPGIKNESLNFHKNIFNAIKEKDAETAGMLMEKHVTNVHLVLRKK